MLFRRKGALEITFLIFLATSYAQTQQNNARSYDTNDWIPVSRPGASEGSQAEASQKRPTGRVLNLPVQDEKRFFPEQQSQATQQQLLQSQRQLPPQPTYIPNGGQQILLPPQLQSLLSQGQAYISPQKLNHQLLPPQSQDYPVLPTQSFPRNTTNYNDQDIIQNINLGLFNQQPVRQQQEIKQQSSEQPEVQLLYVPLENLQRQRGQRQQQVVFPTEQAVSTPQVYNPPVQQQQQYPQHKQVQLQNIEQDFVQQALQAQKLQEQFQHSVRPTVQQHSYRTSFPEVVSQPSTTPAPKKRKPHQPPLAVYMGTGQQEIKIGDVLSLLKDAKTISVQDTISPESPQVFVGPSHLEPPEGYAKFDLPYLSSIDNNRVERKVDQLPFFVAPLSYKAPPGYSKIPFPSPHVGSVVINHAKAIPSTTTEHSNFVGTLEETSSHIPFSQSEVSTIRTTRGRQRQPSRNIYSSSTVQPPVSEEIPYGPLPTKITPEVQQPHSVQDIISPNPYGPTRYIQSTTPVAYNKDVNIPEEIFSTKNRFSTSSPNYNNYNAQNIPAKQYRPEVISTEPTLASSTLSSSLVNDKYTVLEQFPIRQKQVVQQQEESVPQRGYSRPHIRRPTQEPYRTDSSERTALPLISTTLSDQPYRQQYLQEFNKPDYDEVPTRPTKQRVTENYQEIPTRQEYNKPNYDEGPTRPPRQRVTENYQEIPTRQRVTENYQHVSQSSPIRQSSKEVSSEEYNVPVRQISQQSQVRGQQYLENYERNPQFTSQAQTPRTRGKQQYTPETYFQEDFDSRERTTESLVTVTKEPVIEYHQPIQQVHQQSYLQDEPHEDVIPSKQEYTLPAKLPPISPQLPGLINSLQDQQLRPLLAPLLLPPSEEPPVEESKEDSSEEYYSSPEPETIHIPVPVTTTSTTTTTTTTTTPTPVETTTQHKRPRTRQRGTRPTISYDYVSSTTDIPRRTSQYRGRRPYNGQPRQEYKPRENYPSTTSAEVESTTRTVINRNRPAPQRQYVSTTTEQPRRNTPAPRQRFRTRGRPTKSEEDYVERSTPENIPVFKQPALESGFQASAPVVQHQRVQLSVPTSENNREVISQRPQTERALIYVENTNKPILQEASPVFIPRQQFVSSTEAEPHHYSTIAATGPESNFVPDNQEQPNILSTQQQIKYSNPTESNLSYQEESSSQETNVPQPQIRHHSQPIHRETTTTEAPRPRTRIRGKTRRINPNPVSSTERQRYQPVYSSTTTHRTTTEAKQEQEEEFYGFFRQPNFAKPVQTEQPKTEYVSSTSARPNFAYLSRAEEPQQPRVYVNQERSPVVSTARPYLAVEDSYVEPNVQVQRQYVSSTPTPVTSPEPITRRPVARTRRPNSPVRSSESGEQSSEKFYVRPTKRPDVQTTRPTRIRSRIRKPTHPATVQSVESHSRSNELLGENSEEYVAPRQRVINRGKSHFQSPKNEKVTEEPEEENYPVSFLHGVQHSSPSTPSASSPQPVILTTASPSTARPVFQLTIEPEDSEEYADQETYSTVNRPSVVSKDLEQGVEESKFSAKVVEKPSNFNYIISDDKPVSTTEKYSETEFSSTTEEKIEEKTEESILLTTEGNEEVTTTELPVTTDEATETTKSRRRGVWRLVRTRPVADEFESAESQNIQSVFNENDFTVAEKPIRKYKIVQRIRTTTEHIETTPVVETTTQEITTQKPEEPSNSSILAPLLEMFGFKKEQHLEEHQEPQETTTENFNTYPDELTTTTLPNNSTEILANENESSTDDWQSKIIGTSTTTEISHETEICYRGRCVKSTSTEENSEDRL